MQIWNEGLGLIAVAAAVVYWLRFSTRDDHGATGAAVKAASTGAIALILWLMSPGLPLFWLMALGMTLGALGDWLLARKGDAFFLAGMGAFGAGHLAYAAAMLATAAERGFDGTSLAEGTVLALLAALLVSTEVWLAPRTGALRWPVRAYVLLIGIMGLAAALLPSGSGQAALRWGAALFLASDLLLAIRLFVTRDPARQRLLSLALWPAYWGGQALIAAGAVVWWGAAG